MTVLTIQTRIRTEKQNTKEKKYERTLKETKGKKRRQIRQNRNIKKKKEDTKFSTYRQKSIRTHLDFFSRDSNISLSSHYHPSVGPVTRTFSYFSQNLESPYHYRQGTRWNSVDIFRVRDVETQYKDTKCSPRVRRIDRGRGCSESIHGTRSPYSVMVGKGFGLSKNSSVEV